MSSGGLVNGTERSVAVPAPRLSPRLRAKAVWTQGPETRREQPLSQSKSQEQIYRVGHVPPHKTWIPDREEEGGAEPVWMVGQEPGPGQDWVSDGSQGQNQARSTDRDLAGSQGSLDSEQIWGSVQNQDQSWGETSRDGEDIWRPGGFLSTQWGRTNNEHLLNKVLLLDPLLRVILSRLELKESPKRPCGSKTARLMATRRQTPS